MIKRIFSDMDGTLLNSKGRVSDKTAQAIREAAIPVTLVSARAPMEMKEAIDALGLTGIQVGFNGGLVYCYLDHKVSVIKSCPLADEDAHLLLAHIKQAFPNLSQSYYDQNKWYSYKVDAGIDYESQLTLQEPCILDEATYLAPKTSVYKIMLITFDSEEMARLKANLEALSLDGVSIQQSGAFYLEITHVAAKKSAGIDFVLAKENLSKSEVAGLGDGHNDLPMFDRVGLAIAMGNAGQEIKDRADAVTLTNDEDGIAYALENYLVQ
ncbi:Cof-type HAD-IIB family hydrolase [Streptococcus loxodontisalivarius]|uniref:Cof subfamily protein (Haloacid dehalogenase superfamily) n=1 Tax=Streptococcus loxodontisalivarius TaxID=1349415 RepID=A0ABS2PSM2_9STRE|nr:Cof-type HAD-IIB family hydrolase [Streptococcus loxodontisalivarius]MBM7642876.1 Cof subfamily protein (haloacid dehalogenase superfamily) [Streptococcus loxodontisalivarius]